MGSTALSTLALLIAGVALAFYARLVSQLDVPRRPRVYQAAMMLAAVLALAALARSPGVIAFAFALVTLPVAAFFLFTTFTSRLPAGTSGPRVGDRYRDFAAKDWQGRDFRLASLDGRRFILKFYRGHW